jgi:BlaI family penicillinase repressor
VCGLVTEAAGDFYDKLSYNRDAQSNRDGDIMATRPQLANAELAIMELLWAADRLTARQIREDLYSSTKKPQHGTVQRLLQRLEDKGFVERDRDLPVHLFSASFSREEYVSSQLEHLAERLTGGSLAPLVTHMVEQKRISRTEIDRLRQILDEDAESAD